MTLVRDPIAVYNERVKAIIEPTGLFRENDPPVRRYTLPQFRGLTL